MTAYIPLTHAPSDDEADVLLGLMPNAVIDASPARPLLVIPVDGNDLTEDEPA